MNDVGGLYDKFSAMERSFNPIKTLWKDYQFRNLANWCRVAAAIRVYLYKVLFEGQAYRLDEAKNFLRAINGNGSEELTRLMGDIDTLRSEAKQTCDGV